LQRSEADWLDVRDVNLILAARLVDAQRASQRYVQPIVRAKFQQASLIAEADAADLRARVFQREIEVPGLRGAEVRNLAFDPDIAERSFEDGADLLGEFTDFPNAALGLEIEEEGLVHRCLTVSLPLAHCGLMARLAAE